MLGMVDRHVLELLRADLRAALEMRFGEIDPAMQTVIRTLDDFDDLEWLVDRAETEDTWVDFVQKLTTVTQQTGLSGDAGADDSKLAQR